MLSGDSSDDTTPRPERVANEASRPTPIRGCRQRVEGGRLSASPSRDTVIGPVAFHRARSVYRLTSKGPTSSAPQFGGTPMKVIAVVQAGREVTLSVPREQRRWLHLLYTQSNRPTSEITLKACRRFRSRAAQKRECGWSPRTRVACRWNNTQFAGGFSIDFADAPLRGRCAELVMLAPRHRPMRELIFERDPARCVHTAAARVDRVSR